MKARKPLIFALHANARGFGYVVFDGPFAPHDWGTVIAKGKDCEEYQPGAKVLYGKFSGYEQLFDGQNYLILAETEILGERLVTPFDEPFHCDGVHPSHACHYLDCCVNNPL